MVTKIPPFSPQQILPQFTLVVGQSLSEPTGFTFFLFFECLGFTISSSCKRKKKKEQQRTSNTTFQMSQEMERSVT